MARFEINGMDDICESILIRERKTDAAVPEMLKAGGEILKSAQVSEIKNRFASDRSTGDLAGSIKVSSVKSTEGGRYVDVGPTKKDRNGVRNATKGFFLNYGRKNMPANPWFNVANEKSNEKVSQRMRQIWEDYQK